jgi:elongation factor P
MITTNDFKKGVHFLEEGVPYVIMNVAFQSPTARGANTMVKAKVRNLLNDSVHDRTYRSGDKFEQPNLELRPVTYLYSDNSGYHFMDAQSFDQFALSDEELGDQAMYLIDNLEGIRAHYFDGRVISLELPTTVDLKVVECDPTMKGATAKAQTKNAKLETGLVIQVPAYMESGETVRVDTRDGAFVRRV